MEPPKVPLNLRRSLFLGFAYLPICAGLALSQGVAGRKASASKAPTIRAIIINRSEVFDSVEVRGFWGFGLVNALHVQTRPYVVRRELLFEVGEPFDTARVNESARDLRALSIFRDVEIDTVSA